MPKHIIAIDGPAASGKSSVARSIARRLGFAYANSGDYYRALTWLCLRGGVDCGDAGAVARAVGDGAIETGIRDGFSYILIDGEDPMPHLRDDAVNRNVSPVSVAPAVRDLLLVRLRALAEGCDLVMEGRDIGSVVFPDTPFKFYIDAAPEIRIRRRAAQGQSDEIALRDRIDSTRKSAPLTIAEDAQVIDSSHLTIDGVVGEVIGRLKMLGLPDIEP